MGLQIIIRGKDRGNKLIKGRNITEFARNMESNGWPTEFLNEEVRDRVKYKEKKKGGPLTKADVPEIAKEMAFPSKAEFLRGIAERKKLKLYRSGFPEK